MARAIQSKKRYIFAFLIATFLFVLGFVLSYSFSYLEYQRISSIQGLISYNIFSDKLKYSFFEEEVCSTESFRKISEDLGFQGRIIDDLEQKFGKNDKKVLFRKKFYTLILLEHFEFVNTINEDCKAKVPTILFFYSNEKEIEHDSELLGELLGTAYRRNPELVIYSFDLNLESELIDNLKIKYNVTEPLTLIINNKDRLVNPTNINEVEDLL